MGDQNKVVQEEIDGIPSLKIIGPLNQYNNQIIALTKELVTKGATTVAIDMQETSFITSEGLSALIVALKQIRTVGGKMFLVGPTADMVRLLKLILLDRVFIIVQNEREIKKHL
jgi:anti-anti-sigma factor